MKISARIDSDYHSLTKFFERLFDLWHEAKEEEAAHRPEAVDADSNLSQETYHRMSHLVLPDMVLNVYSFSEYWIAMACDHQKKEKGLSLSHGDIRGQNDIHAFQKYLTRYAKVDMGSVSIQYDSLQSLRRVRNKFVHKGGHVDNKEIKLFEQMEGITVVANLIEPSEDFVWTKLDHARTYLLAAV